MDSVFDRSSDDERSNRAEAQKIQVTCGRAKARTRTGGFCAG